MILKILDEIYTKIEDRIIIVLEGAQDL